MLMWQKVKSAAVKKRDPFIFGLIWDTDVKDKKNRRNKFHRFIVITLTLG